MKGLWKNTQEIKKVELLVFKNKFLTELHSTELESKLQNHKRYNSAVKSNYCRVWWWVLAIIWLLKNKHLSIINGCNRESETTLHWNVLGSSSSFWPIHNITKCLQLFKLLVWQSTQQSVRNHNQDHLNNPAQKAMRIHNMLPRFLIFKGVLLWIVSSVWWLATI